MLKLCLVAYAARTRLLQQAHQDVSEPALAPEFQRLLNECLPLIPAAPKLTVVPEYRNPGVGRPDIALTRPGEPARTFIELKHPSKSADPERWTGAHDKRQFVRLQTLERDEITLNRDFGSRRGVSSDSRCWLGQEASIDGGTIFG